MAGNYFLEKEDKKCLEMGFRETEKEVVGNRPLEMRNMKKHEMINFK